MKKNYMQHPNPIMNKYAREMENKNLWNKLQNVKSTVDSKNKAYIQRLEERRLRELKMA